MNNHPLSLITEGLLLHKFSKKELFPVNEEIDSIQKNFTSSKKANGDLVGHIKHEYYFSEETHQYIESLVLPLVQRYNDMYPEYIKNYTILTSSLPYTLQSSWVNFQRKYEFNPVHSHPGIYSFVIWLKVPYRISEENNCEYSINSRCPCSGQFDIFFQDTVGHLRKQTIPVDKDFENSILLFPSIMNHCVYPFYTSDDYRISVSGNIFLKV